MTEKDMKIEFIKTKEKDEFYKVKSADGEKILPSAVTVLKYIHKNGISLNLIDYREEVDNHGRRIIAIVEAIRKDENGNVIKVPDVVSFYIEDKILAQKIRIAQDYVDRRGYTEGEKYRKIVDIIEGRIDDNYLKMRIYETEARIRTFASRIAMTQAQSRAIQKLLSEEDWMEKEERELEEEEIKSVNEGITQEKNGIYGNGHQNSDAFKRFINAITNIKLYYGITDEEVDNFVKEKGYNSINDVPPDSTELFILAFKEFARKNSRRGK